MNLPKHFSLIKENPDHFLVHDSRDNKAFPIAKRGLHPAHQMNIMRLQKFSDGGDTKDLSDPANHNWYDNIIESDPEPQPDQPSPSRNVPIGRLGMDSPPPPQAPQDLPPDQAPPTTPVPQAQGQIPPQGGAAPTQAPQAQPDFNAPPQGYPTLDTLNKATAQEASGINQQAQGQMAQNQALAETHKAYLALEQERMNKYNETMKIYQEQNDSLMKDVADAKIDPEKYWENHSKVSAGIGVLLSGIGAGLQHSTTNLALQTIQNGIDRSIDSQKADLGRKQSLLSDNLRIQGNLMQAENATRIQTSAMLQGKIAQVAAETGNPIIMGRAQQQIAQLKLQTLPQQEALAQYQTQMHMRESLSKMDTTNINPSVFVHSLIQDPADRKQAYEEIKNRSNITNNASKMMEAFDKAAAQVKIPGWERSGPMALHQLLLPNFKTIDGTVRQAPMEETFNNVTPAPLDGPDKLATKRQALKDWIKSESAAPVSESYGINLNKFNQTAEATPGTRVERQTGDGRTAIFDADSKKFLGYK